MWTKAPSGVLFFFLLRYRFFSLWSYVSRMWLACFCVFCSMRVLGCVFVHIGLSAQYHSRSLWSLRGSFPPAPPPVSVLLRTPGLQWLHNLPDLLIKPIRLASLPKIWLLFPICAVFPRCSSAEDGAHMSPCELSSVNDNSPFSHSAALLDRA